MFCTRINDPEDTGIEFRTLAPGGWELIWIHFPSEGRLDRWLDWPRGPGGAGGAGVLLLGGHTGEVIQTMAAIGHISANLAGDLSAASIAEAVGLSGSRLAHLFRSTVGLSVPGYVESRRMERAEHLLRMTDRPVHEVASLAGYNDPLYFSRRFRVRNGSSPRAWRSVPSAAVVDRPPNPDNDS